MKRTIRLTESDLHRVIEESVKRVLRESTRPRTFRLREGYYKQMSNPTMQKLYDYFDEFNWCDSNASYSDVFEDNEIPERAAKEFGLPVDYCIGIYHKFLEDNPEYWDGSWEDDEDY